MEESSLVGIAVSIISISLHHIFIPVCYCCDGTQDIIYEFLIYLNWLDLFIYLIVLYFDIE
jgi:hypothetical protein